MTKTHAVAAVGALADPIRRSLYDYIAGSHDQVTREMAAAAIGISLSKAKFHLDRLEKEGLLEAEHRRINMRSGPGAGRPSKLYSRSRKEVTVSLPERRYDIVGAVLAVAVEQAQAGQDLTAAIDNSAYLRGASDAQAMAHLHGAQRDDDAVERVHADEISLAEAGRTLAHLGFEPEIRGQELVLRNCPFDYLANQNRVLVCSMNQRYVQGILDNVGAKDLESCLAPTPGHCCVVARPAASAPHNCEPHEASLGCAHDAH